MAFFKKVDTRSRKAMADFLSGHFRYHTMNSWNNSTSYAHCMKVHSLPVSREVRDALYDLLDCGEAHERIDDLIAEFDAAHDWRWQAGFNGRSGGYLVLCEGERVPSGYKSYCAKCGQLNYAHIEADAEGRADTPENPVKARCGRCGEKARVNFRQEHMQVRCLGRAVDQGEDYESWSMADLRDRVALVQEFDALADSIVAEAAYLAENYEICEEEYLVPKKRKVLRERVA